LQEKNDLCQLRSKSGHFKKRTLSFNTSFPQCFCGNCHKHLLKHHAKIHSRVAIAGGLIMGSRDKTIQAMKRCTAFKGERYTALQDVVLDE